jgi:hypothetical protein
MRANVRTPGEKAPRPAARRRSLSCVAVARVLSGADRAWNPRHNGVKRQQEGGNTGYFGCVNLLGPRSTTQRPFRQFWHATFTIVQLRFDFLTETQQGSSYQQLGLAGMVPLDLQRTYFTFWDVDTGTPTFAGSGEQVEALQVGPQAATATRGLGDNGTSELLIFSSWLRLFETHPAPVLMEASERLGAWALWERTNPASQIYSGTTYGVGEDSA